MMDALKALGPPPPAPRRPKGEEKGDSAAAAKKASKSASKLYRKSTRATADLERDTLRGKKKGGAHTDTDDLESKELDEIVPNV